MKQRSVQEWKTIIYPALKSKKSEFKLIGYPEATIEDIWQCLVQKVWKGNPTKRLHEIVQDIFHLPVTTYMNFITVDALQIDNDDLKKSIQALTR